MLPLRLCGLLAGLCVAPHATGAASTPTSRREVIVGHNAEVSRSSAAQTSQETARRESRGDHGLLVAEEANSFVQGNARREGRGDHRGAPSEEYNSSANGRRAVIVQRQPVAIQRRNDNEDEEFRGGVARRAEHDIFNDAAPTVRRSVVQKQVDAHGVLLSDEITESGRTVVARRPVVQNQVDAHGVVLSDEADSARAGVARREWHSTSSSGAASSLAVARGGRRPARSYGAFEDEPDTSNVTEFAAAFGGLSLDTFAVAAAERDRRATDVSLVLSEEAGGADVHGNFSSLAEHGSSIFSKQRSIVGGIFYGFGLGLMVLVVFLAWYLAGGRQRRQTTFMSSDGGAQSTPTWRAPDSPKGKRPSTPSQLPLPSRSRPSDPRSYQARLTDPREGTKVKPGSAAQLCTILEKRAKIDLSNWGKHGAKSVEELYEELIGDQCDLKWVSDGNGTVCLQRRVRTLTIRLFAATTQGGERQLKNCGVVDNRTHREVSGKDKDPARKIGRREEVDEERHNILWNELKLNAEWQKLHLTTEKKETQHFYGNDTFGSSLPGLSSKYTNEILWMRVKDVQADGVVGTIGLPHGDNFQTSEETLIVSKSRMWKWELPSKADPVRSSLALPSDSDGSFGSSSESGDEASPYRKNLTRSSPYSANI